MKRNIKIARNVELTGSDKYCVFYDARTLSEIYCFLFNNGTYHVETEWLESMTGEYSPEESFQEVLAKHELVLV